MLGAGNQSWYLSHPEGLWLSDQVSYLGASHSSSFPVSLPRLVFPHQRESKEDEDIISKKYVMDTGVFHFGPLLCGKPRDGYVLPALS